MRKASISIALLATLTLYGCGTEGEAENDQGSSTGDQEPTAEAENVLAESPFPEVTELMATFELPEEERLTPDEARELNPDGLEISDDDIPYRNGFVFDKDTHEHVWPLMLGPIYDEDVPQEPFGTQTLGLFKAQALHVFGNSHSIQGDIVQDLGEITEEDRDIMERDLAGEEVTGVISPNRAGWDAISLSVESMDSTLAVFSNQLEEYPELKSWVDDTRETYQKASTFDKDEWEQAYELYREGEEQLKEMRKAVELSKQL